MKKSNEIKKFDFIPTEDRVLVKVMPDDVPAAGELIIRGESAQPRTKKGAVVAFGTGCKFEEMGHLSVDDVVLFGKHSGLDLSSIQSPERDGYWILREDDLLGVFSSGEKIKK